MQMVQSAQSLRLKPLLSRLGKSNLIAEKVGHIRSLAKVITSHVRVLAIRFEKHADTVYPSNLKLHKAPSGAFLLYTK
jgi:hypothetical protein